MGEKKALALPFVKVCEDDAIAWFILSCMFDLLLLAWLIEHQLTAPYNIFVRKDLRI